MIENSSTKYLDEILLDDKGLVSRDVMDSVKGYCGLFGFVLSICNNPALSDDQKSRLILNILDASMKFMTRRYEFNLELYRKHVSENLQKGQLFKTLSEIPAKMQEDYEMGLEEARQYLLIEIRDILKILNIELNI